MVPTINNNNWKKRYPHRTTLSLAFLKGVPGARFCTRQAFSVSVKTHEVGSGWGQGRVWLTSVFLLTMVLYLPCIPLRGPG